MKRSDFLLTFAGLALSLFAAPNLLAEEKKMTRKEFEEFLKTQLKTAENGDVYVDLKPPRKDIFKRARLVEKEEEFFDRKITREKVRPLIVTPVILEWLCLYEPILDFEKYYKLLDEEEKKLEKEKEKKYKNAGRRRTLPKPEKEKPNKFAPVPLFVVDFLKENNVGLKFMNFSKKALLEKLKEGHPILCYGEFRGDLEERNEKRKTFENILEWRDAVNIMKKSEVSSVLHGFSFITGFNEQSNEFKLYKGYGKSYWITDSELKESCQKLFVIRL